MAVTEQSRDRLHQHLEEALGAEDAATLMEMLGGHATRQDVNHLREGVENLRHSTLVEFADLRTELRTGLAKGEAGLAHLRTEMADLRTEVRTEISELRIELRTGLATGEAGLADIRTEIEKVRSEFHGGLTHHTLALVGTNVVLFGLAVTFLNR